MATLCATCLRPVADDRSVCEKCYPKVPKQACSPNGYGLCSTHPPCDYHKATVNELQCKIEELKRENRLLRRHMRTTADQMEEDIEKARRTAAWLKSAEDER